MQRAPVANPGPPHTWVGSDRPQRPLWRRYMYAYLFQHRVWPACKELLIVQGVFFAFGLLCILLHKSAYITVVVVLQLFGSILSSTWFALRRCLRPSWRSRWRQLWLEILVGCVLLVELLGFNVVLIALEIFAPVNGEHFSPLVGFLLPFPLVFCLFLLRMGIQVIHLWNHLRNSYLRWSLTHAHLMVLLICAGVIGLLGACLLMALSLNQPSVQQETHATLILLTFSFVFVAITGFALICFLPVSAVLSILLTRKLTRRIERLTVATGAVRAGDLGARVMVDGEDEIARLQSDFNTMAVDLEQAMSEVKAERDRVGQLLAARRDLIASISHDLRTPVATVQSYLESTFLAWQEGETPETLHQDLQVMTQQVIRLQSLIDDLFTLSRAEVGHLEMRCVPTDAAQIVPRLVETMAPLAWRDRRVEVLAECALTPVLPLILVDGKRLEQILHNLIHNAIRHTPPGGFVVVSLKAEEARVVMQVKDTGVGIAPADLPQIWERFYRARNARPGSGTGLGLAIVKELTESMHGSVHVQSAVNQGSCFTITFPALPAPSMVIPGK